MAQHVYVLYRSRVNECLILGVFSSVDAARDYADRMSVAASECWQSPRHGRGNWWVDTPHYRYVIEAQTLRHTGSRSAEDATWAVDSGSRSPQATS